MVSGGNVEISVVIPVYGAADSLIPLYERLTTSLMGITPSYEIVFVEDCGPDGSWDVLQEIARHDCAVKAYKLSRNVGQHLAITAGLEHCCGRWAVVMDCDLQDPPEDIPRLYHKAQEGYDIVYARRKEKRHNLFRKLSASLYFKVLNAITQSNIDGEYGSFTIISRQVIDAYLRLQDRNRHYLFVLYWLGFDTGTIEYDHGERHSGKSSYTLGALIQHALEGLFFQTSTILRWIVYFGFTTAAVGLLLAGFIVFQYVTQSLLPGWPSLIVLLLVLSGAILVSVGMVGLYVGQIFEQVQGRPLYVIHKQAHLQPENHGETPSDPASRDASVAYVP